MSEKESHHGHHHHHRMDSASKFKRDSLRAIERRKIFAKWGKIILIGLTIFMGILCVLAYTIG
jgi:hypothetical protein